MKKKLHIVFGFVGKAILIQSGLIQDDEIICFEDPLSLAPLCDLAQTERILKRKQWIDRTLGNFKTEDGVHIVDDTLNKLQATLNNIKSYDRVQLWLGNVDNEKITAARLLYHLRQINIPLFIVDFSKVTFENKIGRILTPIALHQINIKEAKIIDWHFEKLSLEKIQNFISLWEQIRNDDYEIHTFSKDGDIIVADESYYDRYLLARCTNTPQISSKIVGYALCDIWAELGFECSVGDVLLFDRLNILGENDIIEITNRSKDLQSERRIFYVRRLL